MSFGRIKAQMWQSKATKPANNQKIARVVAIKCHWSELEKTTQETA